MFNFLKNDNVPKFEVTGISIISCEYSCRIRDDLRLLLSQNEPYEKAIRQIEDYYTNNIKSYLTDYEYAYYLPLTYIVLAFYSAKNGYYNKELFDKAIDLINGETTLFVWKDALCFEKTNTDSLKPFIESTFGENAYKIAEILTNKPISKEFFNNSCDIPKIISQILFIDGSASKKYQKRKNELLKVKDLLMQQISKPKKPSVSSVLGKTSDYKFTTDYSEGDVLAYKLRYGKFKDKYAIFIVDYIREKRKILCDFSKLVEKSEYFALVDGLYDTIPSEIPNKYLSTGVRKDINDNCKLLNHVYFTSEFSNLEFVKIKTTTPPKLPRSAIFDNYFKINEEELAEEITENTIDDFITNLFN